MEPDVAGDKAGLRKELATRLAALDPDQRQRATLAAGEQLLALPEVAAARRIFAKSPVASPAR